MTGPDLPGSPVSMRTSQLQSGDRAKGGAPVVTVRWREGDLSAEATLSFDASVRRVDGGRALIGGSPTRILRVSEAGAAAIDGWEAGKPVGDSAGRQRLARRLLDGGLAHPRFAGGPFGLGDVTCIVAVHDHARLLVPTLEALREGGVLGALRAVIVADDGSPEPAEIAKVAASYGATVVRREVNGGPAAGRNAALAHVTTPLVAFVDRDVEPSPDWLVELLAHFSDPRLAVAAPRVRAQPGPGAQARFDLDRGPLDLGTVEARVAPGSRVSYVPATALLARRDALDAVGGFDESLRWGEDVDLVWRLVESGHTVRYEPRSVVFHPARPDLWSWVLQRFHYGTSAAPLDERHPGAVAPLSMSGWTAAAWGLAAVGHPLLGAVVGAGAAAMLPRRLGMLEHPWREGCELAGKGQLAAWRPVASAITRTWWPLALGAALVSRRARRAVVLAAVVAPLVDWANGDRALDPVRAVGLRVLDDAAYGAGVWAGCWRHRTIGPLVPTLRSWPGRRPAATSVAASDTEPA